MDSEVRRCANGPQFLLGNENEGQLMNPRNNQAMKWQMKFFVVKRGVNLER